MILCCGLLLSCSYFKGTKKDDKKIGTTALINMTADEVKKKMGEPDIVSLTPDNRIIWTYRPTWKLLPDNADTVYVEFDNNNKVVKITKSR